LVLDRGTQGGTRSQGNLREEQRGPPGASSSHEQAGLMIVWALPVATAGDLNSFYGE